MNTLLSMILPKRKIGTPRLLVITKNEEHESPLKTFLSSQGYDSVQFTDEPGVLSELRVWTPDLVVVDLSVGDVDFSASMQDIRENDRNFGCFVPVLAVSRNGLTEAEKKNLLSLTVDDYLCGDFEPIDFSSCVHLLLKMRELHMRSQFLSTHDPLTRCYNRTFLLDFLKREFDRYGRFKTPVSHIQYKFEGLTGSNADLVLMQLGFYLQDFFRAVDCVAFLGNATFSVVLPGSNSEQAQNVVDRLLDSLPDKFPSFVRCSYELSTVPEHTTQFEDFVRISSQAASSNIAA